MADEAASSVATMTTAGATGAPSAADSPPPHTATPAAPQTPATGEPASPGAALWAQIAQAKAAVAREKAAIAAERAEIEKARGEHEPDLKLAREIRRLKSEGKHLEAMALAELDLASAQDEYIAKLDEDAGTPRALTAAEAERIAEKKFNDLQAAREKAETDRVQAELTTGVNSYLQAIVDTAEAMGPEMVQEKFDLVASLGATPQEIANHAGEIFEKTGNLPSPSEAIAAYEEFLATKAAKSRRFRAATEKPAEKPQIDIVAIVEATGISLSPLQKRKLRANLEATDSKTGADTVATKDSSEAKPKDTGSRTITTPTEVPTGKTKAKNVWERLAEAKREMNIR